jgi:hypothetical protein
VLLGGLAGALGFILLVGPLLLATIAAVVAALHAPLLTLWVTSSVLRALVNRRVKAAARIVVLEMTL